MEIEKIDIEELSGIDEELVDMVKILLSAINDWPNRIETTDQFHREVAATVGGEPNELSINEGIRKQNIAFDAWKVESLYILLGVFGYYPAGTSLASILASIESRMQTHLGRR